MKKKITFLAGCMLMCASIANADGIRKGFRTDRFPDRAPAVSKDKAAANVIQRGLNDEKDLGTKFWATTVTDWSKENGFVYFYQNKTSELKKTGVLKSFEEADQPERYIMTSATYHNGEYLGYLSFYYDIFGYYAKGFLSVDLEKGTYTVKKDMTEMGSDWDQMEGMCTDPKTGKLMGLARNRDGSVTSTFGEINPENGEYSQIATLAEYYFSIAYDTYGTLWAIRWNYDPKDPDGNINGARLVTLDPNNGYKEDKVVRLKKDGSDFLMYFQNTMSFDPSTGDLWVLATNNEGRQYLCRVNTETGEMESMGSLGSGDIATGLYIPGYKADSPEAASRVREITSTFDDNGIVTLKWKNPTTAWNKEELNELAEILIYRDGLEDSKLVTTITDNVTVGGEMTWTDNDAEPGVHIYYVVPCRVKGEKGVPESWRAFTGRDVPGLAENITLTKNGNTSLTLAWEQPSLGQNDGWYDKANVKYDITRYPDKKEISKGITETTITDNDLGNIESYYYTIEAYTSDGKGFAATSEQVMAGSAYNTPYATKFATQAEADQWTPVDANGDGNIYTYKNYMEPWGLYLSSSEYGNDDYAISPAVNLKGGKTYKITFNVYFSYCATDYEPERFQTFSITAGKGATAEAQNIEVKRWDKFQHWSYHETFPFEAFFTPEEDGEYNFAYRYFESPEYDDITVCGASIEEVFANDLTAMSVTGNANAVKGAATDYTVKVKNKGSNAANSYKVQVVRLDGDNTVVLGETAVNEALESQAEVDVKVSATPDVEGEFQMAGMVVLANDEDTGNDISEAITVTADPEGTMPFNKDITGEYPNVNTRTPISFIKIYSHTQAIYNTSEMSGVSKIHRLAFEYNANADSKTPIQDIEIDAVLYLGMSDDAVYSKENSEWKPLSDQTKVFAGKLKFAEGENNMLVFDFDKPFDYDNSKNLVVTLLKSSDKYEEDYPIFFKIYNDDWYAEDYRSMLFDNNNAQEAVPGDGYGYPYLPVLHLAVEYGTGIGEIVVGGGVGITYDGGAINLNGIDAASVAVYDLTGRMIFNKNVSEGMTSVGASLKQGVYVVKVTGRDGKVYTAKMRAAK